MKDPLAGGKTLARSSARTWQNFTVDQLRVDFQSWGSHLCTVVKVYWALEGRSPPKKERTFSLAQIRFCYSGGVPVSRWAPLFPGPPNHYLGSGELASIGLELAFSKFSLAEIGFWRLGTLSPGSPLGPLGSGCTSRRFLGHFLTNLPDSIGCRFSAKPPLHPLPPGRRHLAKRFKRSRRHAGATLAIAARAAVSEPRPGRMEDGGAECCPQSFLWTSFG